MTGDDEETYVVDVDDGRPDARTSQQTSGRALSHCRTAGQHERRTHPPSLADAIEVVTGTVPKWQWIGDEGAETMQLLTVAPPASGPAPATGR